MSRLVKIFALLVSLVIVPTAVAAATKVAGTWERIPSAPSGTLPAATVWTGRQLIVLGRRVGSGERTRHRRQHPSGLDPNRQQRVTERRNRRRSLVAGRRLQHLECRKLNEPRP